MRFAGTRMEGFMGDDRPDFGALSQKALANRTAESTAGTDLMGKTAATGIAAAGAVEAANITGAAQASLANAQGQASIMSGLGSIASSAIGAIPTGGGSFSTPSVKTASTDYSSAFSNPSTYSFNSLPTGFSW